MQKMCHWHRRGCNSSKKAFFRQDLSNAMASMFTQHRSAVSRPRLPFKQTQNTRFSGGNSDSWYVPMTQNRERSFTVDAAYWEYLCLCGRKRQRQAHSYCSGKARNTHITLVLWPRSILYSRLHLLSLSLWRALCPSLFPPFPYIPSQWCARAVIAFAILVCRVAQWCLILTSLSTALSRSIFWLQKLIRVSIFLILKFMMKTFYVT